MHSTSVDSQSSTSHQADIGSTTSAFGSGTGTSAISHHDGQTVVTLDAHLNRSANKKFRVLVTQVDTTTNTKTSHYLALAQDYQNTAKAALAALKAKLADGAPGELAITLTNDLAPREATFTFRSPARGVAASDPIKVTEFSPDFVAFIKSYTAGTNEPASSRPMVWSTLPPATGDLSKHGEKIEAHATALLSNGATIDSVPPWSVVQTVLSMVPADDYEISGLSTPSCADGARRTLVYRNTWDGRQKKVVLELERGGDNGKVHEITWIEIFQAGSQEGSYEFLERFYKPRRPPMLGEERTRDFVLSAMGSGRFPIYLCNEKSTAERLSKNSISRTALNAAIAINHFVQAPIVHPSDLGHCATLEDVRGVIRDLMRIPMTEPVELREGDGDAARKIFDQQLQKLAKRIDDRGAVILSRTMSDEMREADDMRLLVGVRIAKRGNLPDVWVLLGSRLNPAGETMFRAFSTAHKMLEFVAGMNRNSATKPGDENAKTEELRSLTYTTITEGGVVPSVIGGHGMYVAKRGWVGGEAVDESIRTELELQSSDTPWASGSTLEPGTPFADQFKSLFASSPVRHRTQYRIDGMPVDTVFGDTKKKEKAKAPKVDGVRYEQFDTLWKNLDDQWWELGDRFDDRYFCPDPNGGGQRGESAYLGALDEFRVKRNEEPIRQVTSIAGDMLDLCAKAGAICERLLQQLDDRILQIEDAKRGHLLKTKEERVKALREFNSEIGELQKTKSQVVEAMQEFMTRDLIVRHDVLQLHTRFVVDRTFDYRLPLEGGDGISKDSDIDAHGEEFTMKYNLASQALIEVSYRMSAFLDHLTAFMANASLPKDKRDRVIVRMPQIITGYTIAIIDFVVMPCAGLDGAGVFHNGQEIARQITKNREVLAKTSFGSDAKISKTSETNVDDRAYRPEALWKDREEIEYIMHVSAHTLAFAMYADDKKRVPKISADSIQKMSPRRLKDLRDVRDKLEQVCSAYHGIVRYHGKITEVPDSDIECELKVSVHVAELMYKFAAFLDDYETERYFEYIDRNVHAPKASTRNTQAKNKNTADRSQSDYLPAALWDANSGGNTVSVKTESVRSEDLEANLNAVLETCRDEYLQAVEYFEMAEKSVSLVIHQGKYDKGSALCNAIISRTYHTYLAWYGTGVQTDIKAKARRRDATELLKAQCENAEKLQEKNRAKLEHRRIEGMKWKECMSPKDMDALVRAGQVQSIDYWPPKFRKNEYKQVEYLVVIHFHFKPNPNDSANRKQGGRPAVLHLHKASENIHDDDFTAQHFKPWNEKYARKPVRPRNKISSEFRDALLKMALAYYQDKTILTVKQIEERTGKPFIGELRPKADS